MRFPSSVRNLIRHFNQLPGIGPKAAERLVFHLLKKSPEEILGFSDALKNLGNGVNYCDICHNIASQNPCLICLNPERNSNVLCVVNKPQDLLAIEKTGDYQGLYHVLWGVLSPMKGITPDQIKLSQLCDRVTAENIEEIILAFDADIEGESTIMHIVEMFRGESIKISTLAKGLSTGSELEYADESTLSSALSGRIGLK